MNVLFAQRLQTGPVTLRQIGSVLDLVIIEHADVFTLREATRQSEASISAAFDGCGSTLFAPWKVRAVDFACAKSGIHNYSRFPSTLESSIFGALHWEGAYL